MWAHTESEPKGDAEETCNSRPGYFTRHVLATNTSLLLQRGDNNPATGMTAVHWPLPTFFCNLTEQPGDQCTEVIYTLDKCKTA